MSPKMHRLGYWGMRPLSNAKSRQAVTKSESEVRVRGHSPLRLHGLAGAAIAGALSPPTSCRSCHRATTNSSPPSGCGSGCEAIPGGRGTFHGGLFLGPPALFFTVYCKDLIWLAVKSLL